MLTVYGTVRVVQKKLEASFSQNELKDMPGRVSTCTLVWRLPFIHIMILGFFVLFFL